MFYRVTCLNDMLYLRTSLVISCSISSRYRKKVQEKSLLFRDRPQTPLETAIFWTEHVIRHGDAPELRSVAVNLTWFQHCLLDIMALILLAMVTLIAALCICTRWLLASSRIIFTRLYTIMYLSRNTEQKLK